ncbi:bardet-Biedl syndrome 2 protein [Achlya hypogyna]|uniref:Bardet-Biedl syndrome 2 protein n=1 Tax=Achlya hypogyna TaxID=1202772 RepID=A0A1V9ZEG7_ACHHY|nr:bardet-Biedl syndrome 2 protein [Achlya hypogyna]
MLPSFKLHMQQAILERLARVGKFDGTHPSLACATSSGKVFLHNPHEHNDDEGTPSVRFLNINRQISALCVGKFKDADAGDTLVVGTQANILGYNVEKNSDTFYKDVPDGVNTMLFGSLPTIPARMVVVGGNCSIQGFDKDGTELFWTVTGDNVTAMTICDVSGSGKDELVVGSDDFEIRAFQQEDVVCECHESSRIVDLTGIDKHLFGYALDNGTVGVYKGKHRVWRVKSKNVPTSINSFDINGDGDKEIVIGWSNGKFEARNLANGEVVYRDTFAAPIASVLTADYRMRGHEEVLCCAQDGEIRGYMFEGGLAANVIAATALLPDQISAEEKEVQDLIKAKACLTAELKAFENAAAKTTKSGNARLAPATRIAIKATPSIASASLELTVTTDAENVIKMVVVYDYDAGIFDGESVVVRPANPGPSATVHIRAVKKTVSAKLHFKVLVGSRGNASVFHVFEEHFVLPKFGVFAMLKAPLKERPAGHVKLKTLSKMQQQFGAWLKSAFLVSDPIEDGATHEHYFRHMSGSMDLAIVVTPTDSYIHVDDMAMAAEIIQDLCSYLQIEELPSIADFPKQMAEFRDLLVRVDDCNSIRLKLTGEMADDSNQIKNLVIRAEDARLLNDMGNMRSYYAELFTLNNQLLAEYTKRSTNHQALLDALKEVNNMIQLAARLRAGQAKSSVIVACRKAIKANNIHALFYIVKTGQEESR